MNKLETITELLVNELTDFEKNVTHLSSQIDKAESLRVKFDVSPIKGLISQLEEFGRLETEKRNQYLERLQQNLKQAKIYPKWAVITFISALIISFGGVLYGYVQHQSTAAKEKEAYNQGAKAHSNLLNKFFEENPKSHVAFKNWKENQ